jgi:hypothetical protein
MEDLDLHECLFGARGYQHTPAHKEGWMISGQEIILCWVQFPR